MQCCASVDIRTQLCWFLCSFLFFDLYPAVTEGTGERAKVNLLLQVAVVNSNILWSYIDHFSPAGSNIRFTRATRPQGAGVIGLFHK